MSRRTSANSTLALAAATAKAALFAATVAVTTSANATVLYRETFPFPNPTPAPSQDAALRTQGWEGGNAGDAFNNNPSGTPANNGGEGAISAGNPAGSPPGTGVNNNPQGADTRDSFAFWSQTGVNADSFLYTAEYSLPSTNLQSISWDYRDSGNGVGDREHLAFLIGSNWYISDQFWTDATLTTAWESRSVNLSDLTFFARAFNGTTLPSGGLPGAPGALPLPAGQITAFGLWWDGPKAATSRIDNFTLNGEVPEPATLAMLGFGLAALAASRRRAA